MISFRYVKPLLGGTSDEIESPMIFIYYLNIYKWPGPYLLNFQVIITLENLFHTSK